MSQGPGPKPELVRDLGATYHIESLPDSGLRSNVLVECTGVSPVVLDALRCSSQDAITCLTGASGTGEQTEVDVGALNREEVLMNGGDFGSVNANRRPTAISQFRQRVNPWMAPPYPAR